MRATLVRTAGPGQEAIFKIDGREYGVRYGFSWSAAHAPEIGDEFEVELSAVIDDSWPWEQIFAANPDRRIGLEPLGGYSYLALGRISSINPVRIGRGILVEERAIHTHDPRVIGEFVGFRIRVPDAEGQPAVVADDRDSRPSGSPSRPPLNPKPLGSEALAWGPSG